MRQALSILIPLLAPTLLYLYLKSRGGTPIRIAAKDAPWVWLAGGGVALTAVGLIAWGLSTGAAPNSRYIPSHMEQGKLVPGEFLPQESTEPSKR